MKEHRVPVLVILSLLLLACVLAASAGCGGSKSPGTSPETSTSPNTGPSTGSSPGGVTQQQIGVPVYPGTRPEQTFAGIYQMTTTDSFDQVVAFYKKELPKATFSEITIPTGKGASLVVDESGFHGNVSVEENLPEKGQVTIRVSKFNQ